MDTLIVKLPLGLALRLETAAGRIGMTREEATIEALRLFTRSVAAAADVKPTKRKARR